MDTSTIKVAERQDRPRSHEKLRIACLIPSATDICVALGLQDSIVGITHECISHFATKTLDPRIVQVLTLDMIHAAGATTQSAIHELVQQNSQQHCNSRRASLASSISTQDIPSLYPIVPQKFSDAKPNLIFTQDLCNVCAPNSDSVRTIIAQSIKQDTADETGTNEMAVRIVSLSPKSIKDVLETFRIIGNACYLPEQGEALIETFSSNLRTLTSIIQQHTTDKSHPSNPKSMLILEWLEPPFDAGHWILDMMESIGLQNMMVPVPSTVTPDEEPRKSKSRSWDTMRQVMMTQQQQLENKDDASIVVACCGFDLQRTYDDTLTARDNLQRTFPTTYQANRIYACDGNTYFVNPGPNLLYGITILALIAYDKHPQLIDAIQNLPYWKNAGIEIPYRNVNFLIDNVDRTTNIEAASSRKSNVPDMEDGDFYTMHRQACDAGMMSYIDPVTKYTVFTELAHQARGKCCGSGCRHCPYAHANVRSENKGQKIQQPAVLCTATENSFFSVTRNPQNVKVVFNSGGKDSFLTIRAMIREAQSASLQQQPFGLVLLTTFDAESRIIAHQDILIDVIIRQAQHLDISLIGVPMHRGSSESYVERVRRGIQIIEAQYSSLSAKVSTLVFGDLHLEHIKGWRDQELGPLGYKLQYPLFRVPYDTLIQDLEASQVPCIVTSSTVAAVKTGELYDSAFRHRLSEQAPTVDVFGENGEFHTVAKVWKIDRTVTLGLK
jgi:diphthamide synthase (EF-2-diphthine--ammonia ligase)/ABC-type Fe3+-hydroxamate transport system substrate-binding protein